MKFPFQVYFVICFFTYTTGIEYDYLVVSFQWPFTRCRKFPRNSFSIHGVWPIKYRGPGWQPGPFYCPGGKFFDSSVV